MKDNSIGKSLRRLREEYDFTQSDIADAIGVNRATYTYYETGRTEPSFKTVCALAKIYNVTVGYLIGEEANNPELRVRSNAVSSESDPIAMLKKDERLLLMYFRLVKDESKEEILKSFIEKCRETAEAEESDC